MRSTKIWIAMLLFAISIGATINAQSDNLFRYYQPQERQLNSSEQIQFDQLWASGIFTEIKIAAVRDLGTIKNGINFNVNYNNSIKTVTTDHVITNLSGEYYVSGVIGSDTDPEGFTNFTCNYSIKEGVTGQISNERTEDFYQIIPIKKPNDEDHLNPEVFICKWIPTKHTQLSGCSTPASEPDPEDNIDEDEIDTREICNRTIRVLFLFTNRALTSGNTPNAVSDLIINELNASIQASEGSGIYTVAKFESAGTFLISSLIETNNIGDDLNFLQFDPTANQLRDDNFADIVVTLTNSSGYNSGGRALDIKTDDDSAYAIAQIGSAATSFTGSHEIGHLMGCRHQRCLACSVSCDPWGRGHGYGLCTSQRTIMHRNCGTRTRAARFSNEDSDFMGCSSGNWLNNNIRSIRNHACTVASFRDAPPISTEFSINLFGIPFTCSSNNSNWTAEIEEAPNSSNIYNFAWSVSENGVSGWCSVGNNSSNIDFFTILSSGCLDENQFYLRVVSSINGDSEIDQMFITISDCTTNDEETENRMVANGNLQTVYPNPTNGIINYYGDGKVLGVTNSSGQLVNTEIQSKSADLSNLKNGTYFLIINKNGNTNAQKIIKQ